MAGEFTVLVNDLIDLRAINKVVVNRVGRLGETSRGTATSVFAWAISTTLPR